MEILIIYIIAPLIGLGFSYAGVMLLKLIGRKLNTGFTWIMKNNEYINNLWNHKNTNVVVGRVLAILGFVMILLSLAVLICVTLYLIYYLYINLQVIGVTLIRYLGDLI